MRIRWQPPVMLLAVTGLFWLLLDSTDVRAAVLEGLSLCASSVIPALFPFLVVSSYNINYGTGTAASRVCFVFVAKAVQWENFGLT